MKTIKVFDKLQIILVIIAGTSYFLSILFEFMLVANITTQVTNDATEEQISELMMQSPLYLVYMIFFFAFIVGLSWFIARLITFKARKKEYEHEIALKNLVNKYN